MSYTARQYEAQRRIQDAICQANATGLCVVCMRRPQATWPDGVRRITCGEFDCYYRWLNVRPDAKQAQSNPDDK